MVLTPPQRRAIDRRLGAPVRRLIGRVLSTRIVRALLPWAPTDEGDIFTASFQFLAKSFALAGSLLTVLIAVWWVVSLFG